jgi:hypothetical protein
LIYLLNTSIYNGDALTRLKLRAGEFPMHEYYTVGMRAPVEAADIIREYNIVNVTVVNDIIMASGTADEWRWLDQLLRTNTDDRGVILADNIKAALPKVFLNANTKALVRR